MRNGLNNVLLSLPQFPPHFIAPNTCLFQSKGSTTLKPSLVVYPFDDIVPVMHLTNVLPALFVASASAATFVGFIDNSCMRPDGRSIAISATELEDIVVNAFPSTPVAAEASRMWTTSDDQLRCPSNADDTYKWV